MFADHRRSVGAKFPVQRELHAFFNKVVITSHVATSSLHR